MTQQEIDRLGELRAKDHLDEKEFAQWEFLERKVITDERVKQFRLNQQAPYSEKRARAVNLAWEFYRQMDGQCYVAVGGLDSIVLYLFLRSIGINVPAISVSSLEDKSIQHIHQALGVIALKPLKSKVKVIREFGWPVISKEIAGKISTIQHPTEKNATVRHAIITGETGAQGGYRTGTRMQMKQRWLNLFGGADAEGAALGYAKSDFLVSDKCCYYLKEMPCEIYRKESGRWPYMGLMASEGGRREKALAINGCKVKSNLADTIAKQQQEIESKPSETVLDSIITKLADSLTGAKGGSIRFLDTDGDGKPDELYIADNPDPDYALKVWRFNYEGWAASSTGYNGPWTLGATLADGLLAEFVTAANLIAGTIQSRDADTFFLDLDNGILRIKALDKLSDDFAALKVDSDSISIAVSKLLTDGVTSVRTETGYTFDADGLWISKLGQEIINRIDNTGMYVSRSGDVVFQANADGVEAENVKVRKYLNIGKHSRIEDFKDSAGTEYTACFWI